MLDLNTLAAEVEAVLNRHATPHGRRHASITPSLNPSLWATYSAAHNTDEWELTVHPAHTVSVPDGALQRPVRITYSGEVTAVAMEVLSIIYAHVNGQGGEEPDPLSALKAAEMAFVACCEAHGPGRVNLGICETEYDAMIDALFGVKGGGERT